MLDDERRAWISLRRLLAQGPARLAHRGADAIPAWFQIVGRRMEELRFQDGIIDAAINDAATALLNRLSAHLDEKYRMNGSSESQSHRPPVRATGIVRDTELRDVTKSD